MEPNTKYTKKLYNKFAKPYIESMKKKRFANEYIEIPAIKRILGNIKGKKILDAGCASGTHSKLLFQKGAKVTGVDVSDEMVKAAKNKVPKADFYVGDIQKLPFPNNTFDIVFYGLCIHYVKDLNKVFKEAYKVLKKNGRLIVSTHNPYTTGHKRVKINKKHIFYVGNYFSKELEEWEMVPGMKIRTYQRTISELFNPIIKAGFRLSNLVEPQPIKKAEKLDKIHYNRTMKRPYFIIIEAVKPQNRFNSPM